MSAVRARAFTVNLTVGHRQRGSDRLLLCSLKDGEGSGRDQADEEYEGAIVNHFLMSEKADM